MFTDPKTKISSLDEIRRALAPAGRAGRTVVFGNGCFDLIHVGHVRYLQGARALGEVLVIGINSDESVRRPAAAIPR
jgi:cytidyltransferase-like protein